LENRLRTPKIALVTGSSGPLGTCISASLVQSGFKVIGVDYRPPKDSIYISEFVECDFLDQAKLEQIMEPVFKRNHIQTLVNNAAFTTESGLGGFAVRFEEQTRQAVMDSFQVNVMAPFTLSQFFHKHSSHDSNNLSIVNIGSIYGVVAPNPSLYLEQEFFSPCGYGMSKAALIHLTKYLSIVLAPKIRVNTVSPGGIKRHQNEQFIAQYESLTPLKRMNSEIETTEVITFLASEKSSYITGQNFIVDGGWTTW